MKVNEHRLPAPDRVRFGSCRSPSGYASQLTPQERVIHFFATHTGKHGTPREGEWTLCRVENRRVELLLAACRAAVQNPLTLIPRVEHRVRFELTYRLITCQTICSRRRYDHFGTGAWVRRRDMIPQ